MYKYSTKVLGSGGNNVPLTLSLRLTLTSPFENLFFICLEASDSAKE